MEETIPEEATLEKGAAEWLGRRVLSFIAGTDAMWRCIGPEYRRYLENDPTLDDEARKIKLGTVEMFDRLLEDAKKYL